MHRQKQQEDKQLQQYLPLAFKIQIISQALHIMMQDIIVKYGDLVVIHAFKPSCEHESGILLSKGFSDPDLYFACGDLTDVGQLSIFQLLPRSSFEIHEEAALALEKQVDIMSRQEKEVELFHINIKLMEGVDIHFGEVFVLKHLISKSYLKGSLVCGEAGFGSFKLELTNELSNDILFKVATYRSFEKEGEKFRYNTPFKLHHIKSNSYTNYIDNPIFISREFDDPHPYNLVKQPVRFPTGNQSKSDLLLSLTPSPKMETSKIQHGDVIQLTYSQNLAYLRSDIQANEIYLKQSVDNCYDCLWEVRFFQNNHKSMYLVNYLYKNVLGISGGKVELINNLAERIEVRPIDENHDSLESTDLVNLSYQNLNLTKIEKLARKDENKLQELYERNNTYYRVDLIGEVVEHSFKVVKLPDHTRNKVDMILSAAEVLVKMRCLLDLGTNKDQVETEIIDQYTPFLQQKIINTLKMLITKLYECHSYEEVSLPKKKPNREIALILKDVGIIDMVTQMIGSFGKVYNCLKNFDQFSGQANQIESLILVFYYCYEVLKRLCEFPDLKLYISQNLQLFLEHFYQVKETFVEEFLWVILTHNHTAILHQLTADDIALNIEKFNEESQKEESEDPGSAYIKLLRFFCFSGTQSVRVNQDLVKRLFFSPSNLFLIFLSFEDSKLMVRYNSTKLHIMDFFHKYKLRETWKYLYQYLQLLADIAIHQNTENSEYISQHVINYETICELLNSNELREIEKEVTESESKVRSVMNPLIRVVHACYIDVQGFETIRRIAKVRQWKDIDKKNMILKSHSSKKKNQLVYINRVLHFIKSYLQEFKSTFDFEYNRALLSLLGMLRCTITLGFWEDVEQFRELLPLLMRVVKYESQWIISQVEQQAKGRMLTTSQLEALMSEHKQRMNNKAPKEFILCKIKCLDIIDIMMDMETNTRVSLLTFFLKGIYTKTIDFEKYEKKVELEFNSLNNSKSNENISLNIFNLVAAYSQPLKNVFENENLWLNRIRELTPAEKETVEETKVKRYFFDRFKQIEDVFLTLMELSEYRDYELMSYALLILSRVFGQRKDLINNFENVIIVAEGNFNKLSKTSREEIRSKLKFLQIPNITQLTKEQDEKESIRIWKFYNKEEQIKEEKLKSGVVQDLNYLIETMKIGRSVEDKSLKNIIPYESLGTGVLLGIYTERDQPNPLYQKLIKNQDSHLLLLRYIQLVNNPASDEIHMRCLHAIYNYLTMLIWNHSKNKLDLTKDFKLVTKHLHWNIGVADFVKQLFKNNEILAKSDVSEIVETLLEEIVARGGGDYYKSKLLDIFRPLTIFNDRGIKKRQLDVLSAFQKRKFQTIPLHNLDHLLQDYSQSLTRLVTNLPTDTKHHFSSHKLQISPQLTFLITFFHIFSCAIESNHQVNIGKCSNFHPYQVILSLIEKSFGCWPLLRHLRGYINRLYYIPVEYDILMFDEYVKRELVNLSKEVERFIQDYQDGFEVHSLVQIEMPVRFTYLASYTYCGLIECLTSFYEMLMKPKFADHLRHAMEGSVTVVQHTLELIELVGYLHYRILMRRGKSKFLLCYLKNIKKAYFKLLDVIPFSYLFNRYDKGFLEKTGTQEVLQVSTKFHYDDSQTFFRNFVQMVRTLRINNVREELLKNNAIQSYGGSPKDLDQLTKKIKYIDFMFSKVLRRFQHFQLEAPRLLEETKELKTIEESQDEENIMLNSIHEKICQNMQNMVLFKSYKDNEFMQFVKIFLNFDQLQLDFYKDEWKSRGLEGLPIVTMRDFVISVIDMIRLQPSSIKTPSKVEFIKILRLFVTESVEEGKIKVPVDQWTAEYIPEELKHRLIERQDFLITSNCHLLIFAIFKESLSTNIPENLPILGQLLLLTIALLFGGNRKCQQTLLESMRSDECNQMLMAVSQIISYLGKQLYKLTKIKDVAVVNEAKFQITIEDTYDSFNASERIMERKFVYNYNAAAQKARKSQKSDILSRTFRFLQLLCENNNIDMKIFLRQQKDIHGVEIANSINFIEQTTFLLRRFFKIMNVYILEIPLNLLDFINEVTQLPCVENQITLCKSSYFEDVCFMETSMTKEKRELRLILENEDRDKLYEIYNKTVGLALSNMEGNKAIIFQQIRNKLSLSFLKSLAVYNFEEALKESEINSTSKNNPISEENVREFLRKLSSKEIPSHYIHLLNIVSLLKKENDNKLEHEEDRLELLFKDLQPLRILQKQLLRIEINLFSRQYIYFPRFPLFSRLSKQTRTNIMQNVDRETQRDKLNGLFGYTREIIEEMQVLQTFETQSYNHWKSIATIISCVLNVLVAFGIDIDVEYGSSDVYYHERNHVVWVIIKTLSFLQLFFSLYYLKEWMKVRSPLAFKKYERIKGNVEEKTVFKDTNWKSRLRERMTPLIKLYRIIKCLYLYENEFGNIVIFILASIMGVLRGPQFFSIHLVFLFTKAATMKSVIQAVTSNIRQLLTVSLLGVFFIYAFAINGISFSLYSMPEEKKSCQNVMDCLLTLYISGSIGDDMETFQFWRFLGDLVYIVVMELLFSNIVSGIMIDTFAELKDKKNQIQEDMTNKCFICGITRSDVEKKNRDFEVHIKQEHYLWNYIFYIYCLRNKDETDYSGIEYSISEKLQKEDLSWIPVEEENEDGKGEESGMAEALKVIKGKLEEVTDK